MDNPEFSLPQGAPPRPLPTAAPSSAYPSQGAIAPGGENPFGERSRAGGRLADVRKRIGSALAAAAALIAKFFAAIKGAVLLLPKAKVLTTAGTALVSVVLYSLVFGWWFAVGFVVLLFVHEMGHVIQLRREGIRAGAPVFIPFLGAVVGMKQMPDDALAEARVGLAGPILGSLGAAACLALALATGSTELRALAYVGFLLNLINLVPLTPFDGGRAMAAMAPAMWFVGLGVTVALLLVTHITFLWIFVLLGGYDTYRRWKLRGTRSLAQAAYYRVSPRARMLVGTVYIALVALLAAGMIDSEVVHYAGHTFNVR
ncbi:MAG TPA: site-2 protease family protein [Solirubrobacteraceae bacterium]|nr:site-2 protease family protein [Solirubrobacteraceae bacterium]